MFLRMFLEFPVFYLLQDGYDSLMMFDVFWHCDGVAQSKPPTPALRE